MWEILLLVTTLTGNVVALGHLDQTYHTKKACERALPKSADVTNLAAVVTLHGHKLVAACGTEADLQKLEATVLDVR
jgi:hypothetical protein